MSEIKEDGVFMKVRPSGIKTANIPWHTIDKDAKGKIVMILKTFSVNGELRIQYKFID